MKTTDVKAKTGIYRGMAGEDGIRRFYGVHYAKKPQRWKIAEPLDPSEEIIEAFEPGDACPQPFVPNEWPSGPVPNSEDCLWLNIWSAADDINGKPVLVWIHGGSFTTASARFECFNGSYGDLNRIAAANPDIVFVSINYRLNLLGSIDLRAFEGHEGYEDSNDLEIHDMIAALRWVNENIAAFGGDPDNVTIMGQSAGGWAALALCIIPEANKYFKKSITSSSGPSEFNRCKTDEVAFMFSNMLKAELGVNTVEELLAIPAEDLGARGYEFLQKGISYEPCSNGRLFPVHPNQAWLDGVAKDVAILAGTEEGDLDTMFYGMNADQLEQMLPMFFARGPEMGVKALQMFLANYPERDKFTAYLDALNDVGMRGRVLHNVEKHVQAGGKAYVWYCDYKPEGAQLRTQHVFDVANVFDMLDANAFASPLTKEPIASIRPSKSLQQKFQKSWMSFVRTGDPNCKEIGIEWAPYDTTTRPVAEINEEWRLIPGGIRPKDFEIGLAMHTEEGLK